MLAGVFRSIANVLAPVNGSIRSFDSLPPFAYDADDVMERGGGGSRQPVQHQQQQMVHQPPLVDEEEIALASFTQSLPSEERMRLIYADIKKTSPQVRMSNLYVYDMISTIETVKGTLPHQQDEYREVMWMTATHLYMDIILHNRRPGGAFPGCKIHIGSLACMAMRGVYKTHVNACAELVWRTLYAQGYELYTEDGKLVKETPAPLGEEEEKGKEEEEEKVVDVRKERKQPSPAPETVAMTDAFDTPPVHSVRWQMGKGITEEDFTPPDVDATTMEGGGKRSQSRKGGGDKESSKDK